jgi:hypothetical protein
MSSQNLRQIDTLPTRRRHVANMSPTFPAKVSEGAQQVAPTQQTISSTILKLIDTLISEGAQFDSNLY